MDPHEDARVEPVVLPDVATGPHPTAPLIPPPPGDLSRDGSTPAPAPTDPVDPKVGGRRHGEEPSGGPGRPTPPPPKS